MPNSLNAFNTKDNDKQVNGLHIKDIVEMQLKPYQSNTFYFPTQVLLERKTVNTLSLINSGTELDLIDRTLIKDWGLPRRKLKKPLVIWNGDESINKNKKITDYVKLDAIIDQQRIKLKLTIMDLGQPQIILEIL